MGSKEVPVMVVGMIRSGNGDKTELGEDEGVEMGLRVKVKAKRERESEGEGEGEGEGHSSARPGSRRVTRVPGIARAQVDFGFWFINAVNPLFLTENLGRIS